MGKYPTPYYSNKQLLVLVLHVHLPPEKTVYSKFKRIKKLDREFYQSTNCTRKLLIKVEWTHVNKSIFFAKRIYEIGRKINLSNKIGLIVARYV